MARSLTAAILEAHALPDADDDACVRVDHAVAAGDEALLVLAAFAATEVPAARTELALVCADSRTALEALGGGRLRQAAARAGARFAAPGLGDAARVHLECAAAPLRLALGCGASLAGAGGVGALAFEVDALELASAWASGTCGVEAPRVVRIALEGELPPGTSAVDLMLTLAASPRAAALRDCVLEFTGPAVPSVPVEERIAAAAMAPELGALAAVWPSDEATRAWLAAHGREADWRAADADAGAMLDRAVDLSGLEPMCAPVADAAAARPAHAQGVVPVTAVVIGPGASASAFADALRDLDAPPAPDAAERAVPVVLVPGSGGLAAALEARLAAAPAAALRARVAAPGDRLPVVTDAAEEGVGLCLGIELARLPGAPSRWRLASAATCAASARAGRLEDARGSAARAAPVALVGAPGALLAPSVGDADEGVRALALPPEPTGAVRGGVLLVAGDDLAVEDLLPWGPRLRPLLADLEALAEHAFEGLDPGFAARARAAGGGIVVAGARCGGGRVRDRNVLVLVALGVRVVLARSFEPAFARALAACGVLPLSLTGASTPPGVGDQLEVPFAFESLRAGRPLAVRNLTRGHGYTARLEVGPRDAARARAGGRLRAVSAR